MRESLAIILVVMAGGFLLYALRLVWLRKFATEPEENGDAVAAQQTEVRKPPPPRMQLEDFERVPPAFTGAFHSPLAMLRREVWWAVWYVLATLALATLLLKLVHPLVLFTVLQIPLIVLCGYVVAPDPNVARRLPFIWSLTAVLAALIYLLPKVESASGREALNNATDLLAWLFIFFGIFAGALWSLRLMEEQKGKLDHLQTLELLALLCATWGAVFEIASLLVWLALSLWSNFATTLPTLATLSWTVSFIKLAPALQFLPLEIVFISLLVLTALRMRDDHYVPRSLNEFLPIREDSFFAPFVMAVRIPVWIVVVIIEFSAHFIGLAREAATDFARRFLVRLGFILFSFALAPLLLYFGHALMLQALDSASLYFVSFMEERIPDPTFLQSLGQFLLVNGFILVALVCYALAVPPLAARYRRVLAQKFSEASRQELFVQGKTYVLALGQTFSLLGVLPFAIPVITFLPDGISPGVFSLLYAVLVIVAFAWYVGSKDEEDEDEEEEVDDEDERLASEEAENLTDQDSEPQNSAQSPTAENPSATPPAVLAEELPAEKS